MESGESGVGDNLNSSNGQDARSTKIAILLRWLFYQDARSRKILPSNSHTLTRLRGSCPEQVTVDNN